MLSNFLAYLPFRVCPRLPTKGLLLSKQQDGGLVFDCTASPPTIVAQQALSMNLAPCSFTAQLRFFLFSHGRTSWMSREQLEKLVEIISWDGRSFKSEDLSQSLGCAPGTASLSPVSRLQELSG